MSVISAALLPPAILQFCDSNGAPLAGGQVSFFVPNTNTYKNVWADPAQTILLQNPVPLDAGGRPQTGGAEVSIYGNGQYTMLVQDSSGNVIWAGLTEDALSLANLVLANLNVTVLSPTPALVPGDLINFQSGSTVGDAGFQTNSLIRQVYNVPAVRALTILNCPQSNVYMAGYNTLLDGGEGYLVYDSTDLASPDNGGTIFVDASNRRWKRPGNFSLLHLEQFGGTAAASDCSGALALALAALPPSGGRIEIGSGTRTFLSTVTYNFPLNPQDVLIEGTSQSATILVWPNSSGIVYNGSSPKHSFHFRDLSIASGAAGGNFIGFLATNSVQGGVFSQSDFTRVSFLGSDGGGLANFWSIAISIVGWNNIDYEQLLGYGSSNASGTIVQLSGNLAGQFKYALVHNFVNCGFFNHAIGISYGSYVQGVQVINCNFTNGVTDIYTPPGTTGQSQLAVSNCQLAGSGNRILIDGPIAQIILTGNLFFIPANQVGLSIAAITGQCAISNNVFTGLNAGPGSPTPGTVGIYTLSTAYANIVTGNTFYGLGQGINLQGSPNGWQVGPNMYSNVPSPVVNPQGNVIISGG